MKVLVTGATGFVGGHVVDQLLARGDSITALVRDPKKAAALEARGVRLVVGDLTADRPAIEATATQDLVLHVAGLTSARTEAEFLAVNREGTARLARAAAASGARRFVLVSSLAAAGPTERSRPLTGDEPPHPTTQYGRSKLAGEEAIRATRLDWTIVRPPVVYGPGDRELFRLFKAALAGFAPVFGDGSQSLSLVYGPDLAAAIVAAGASAGAVGRTLYPAHPEIVTSRGLVDAVGRAVGRPVRVIGIPEVIGRALLEVTDFAARLRGRSTLLSRDKANEFFQPAWICDPGQCTKLTGWRAATDLATGSRLTFDWYRSAGWL